MDTERFAYSLKFQVPVLFALIAGLFLLIRSVPPYESGSPIVATSTQVSAAAGTHEEGVATSTEATTAATEGEDTPDTTPMETATSSPTSTSGAQIHRIENPYATLPFTFESINDEARAALVNIFCSAKNGSVRPISGSGTIIDADGVILTNAHVAQYVMLAESRRVNLQCQIRSGNPAAPKWSAHVLFLPPIWIDQHAQDFTKEKPVGTGLHDYALLLIGNPLDGSPRPSSFPSLTVDTRNGIGFVDDSVLAASYPAEFLGTITTTSGLFPVTSITEIRELFTLGPNTVDVLSIGGVIGAQSGSSGGSIVNAWARLIGVITTTSEGKTTGERDLRGITLSYIDRDIAEQSGKSLSEILSGDLAAQAAEFTTSFAPPLVEKLLDQIR